MKRFNRWRKTFGVVLTWHDFLFPDTENHMGLVRLSLFNLDPEEHLVLASYLKLTRV
jgi:hypothetical protein